MDVHGATRDDLKIMSVFRSTWSTTCGSLSSPVGHATSAGALCLAVAELRCAAEPALT